MKSQVFSIKEITDARNEAAELLSQVQGIWKPPTEHHQSAMKKVVFDIRDIIEDVIKINHYHDNSIFWEVEIDELHNFKYYFTNKNPHCFKDFSLKSSPLVTSKVKFTHNTTVPMKKIRKTEKRVYTDDLILNEDSLLEGSHNDFFRQFS